MKFDSIVTAFAPANITGIFAIFPNGSAGAGVMLDRGAETDVRLLKGGGKISIAVNENDTEAPVSFQVIQKFKNYIQDNSIEVKTNTAFPVGYGFGMSGAGSFSLSLALNEVLNSGFSYKDCMEIATAAEISCGTGIGTVKTQQYYGFIIGTPPYPSSKVEIVDCEEDTIVCGFLEPIDTDSIINDSYWKELITSVGVSCMQELEKEKTIAKFIELSRYFTLETGLAGPELKELMQVVEKSSMAMLGQTAFAVVKKDEAEEISEVFRKYTKIVKIVGLGKKPACLL